MSSGMFRGKDFSNRIELLVIWAPCGSLWLTAALERRQIGWGHLEAWGYP